MEDEPVTPQPPTRRSVCRFHTHGHEDVLEEERGESSDDFEVPRRKAKRNKATEGASYLAAADLSLIEVIKGERKEIPDVVKRWVEQYERNQKSAMAELLTMIFEACGAKYRLQEEDIDETDVDDVVVALVNMARRGEVEDCQSSKKDFKNFKDNLEYFLDTLVSECQNGPLFDQTLFNQCLDYIIALSCTPPRSYRQMASLMGLKLVTSFINVAKILGSQRDTTQRQLDAEKKKKTEGPRVESLTKRLSMTHEKITKMEDLMWKFFEGLFSHRYQDIDPDIRMSCIESLGVWVLSYPSLFLQDYRAKHSDQKSNFDKRTDSNLIYFGWTLNDKVDDYVPSRDLLTKRFYKRMIELADDIDISVSVCAIGLVKQLLRHQLVPDKELGPLYDLLIDDPADVRHTIGALVYDHLIAQKFNKTQSRSTGSDSDSSEVHISRMLKILKKFSADPILISYVIDDVWEYMGAMKDWKCIIRMLLADNPSAELDDVDATNLIRLLFASIRKAVGERIVPATDNRNPHHTKAQREMFESNKRDITVAMMKTFPQLIRKFMSDKDKVSPLVEIVVHMNLERYSLKRQEQNGGDEYSLLVNLKRVNELLFLRFFVYGSDTTLISTEKVISGITKNSEANFQNYKKSNLKGTFFVLIMSIKGVIYKKITLETEHTLIPNVKVLIHLLLKEAVHITDVFDDRANHLSPKRNKATEVQWFRLLLLYTIIAWCVGSDSDSSEVHIGIFIFSVGKRDALLEQLEYFLHNPSKFHGDGGCKNQLAYRVCGILADIWCLFKRTKFALTKLEILGYSPDEFIVEKYWKMCEQLLNVSDDAEDEEGNKEYVEETNADAVMFALGKLVATDSVPKEHLAPEIISHLENYGTSVGEIVKHLLTALKKKGDISNILLEALKRAYQRYLVVVFSGNDESQSSKSFQECKNLAARLSGSYVGVARNKYKAEILNIVKEGINYAFSHAPKQLSFLEGVVLHFVSKLPAPDILDIMRGVERRTENVKTDEDPSGWRPYYTFLDTLREKYLKNEAVKDGKEGTSVRRRGRPRKNQNLQGKRLFDDQSSSEEEDSISGSDQDAGAKENQEEDEPLIHSIRASSKLRSLRVSKDKMDRTKTVDSGRATDELATPKTSGTY
ncbi:hypothetical protein DH2020_001639 [Rehmannia glutinosa]|uniref:SCD domain-containing protein n=1 Tax=Rehmannia glutinosa TaxID=99300 RepID=A0ABR0Y0G2_REHGL